MTVEEMVRDVFENLGEPTDLAYVTADDVVDTTSDGWTRVIYALQRGLNAVSRWKNPRTGRRFRWPGSTSIIQRQVGTPVTGTVATGSTTQVVAADIDTYVDGYFVGWLFEYDDEVRRIAYSDSDSIVLTVALSSAPTAGTTYTLRRTSVAVTAASTVLRVIDALNGTELSLVRPESILPTTTPTYGDPTSYYQIGNRLYVDPVPEEGYLTIECESLPTIQGTTDEEIDFPEEFLYAVILWATAWGFGRYMNPEMKITLRREFNDYMQSIQLPEDAILDRQEDAFIYRKE